MTGPQRIIVRVEMVGGNLHLCRNGMSLLYGVAVSEITAGMDIPQSWAQAAARRINEAGAHGGCEGLSAVLAYWAGIEYPDAELVVIGAPT